MIEAKCQVIKDSLNAECGRIATTRIRPEAPFFVCEDCLKLYNSIPNFHFNIVQEQEEDLQLTFDW